MSNDGLSNSYSVGGPPRYLSDTAQHFDSMAQALQAKLDEASRKLARIDSNAQELRNLVLLDQPVSDEQFITEEIFAQLAP